MVFDTNRKTLCYIFPNLLYIIRLFNAAFDSITTTVIPLLKGVLPGCKQFSNSQKKTGAWKRLIARDLQDHFMNSETFLQNTISHLDKLYHYTFQNMPYPVQFIQ